MRHIRTVCAVSWGLMLSLAGGAAAATGDREWLVTPYLWGANSSMDLLVDGDPVLGRELDFDDLLDKLDLAVQVHAETRRNMFGLLADFTYLQTSENSTVDLVEGLMGDTRVDTENTTLLYEVGGFYRASGESSGFDVLFGIRVIDTEIEVRVTPPDPLSRRTYDSSDTLVDAFVGMRYSAPVGDHWLYSARLDMGAGDSDLSWNAAAVIGYRFGQSGRYNLLLGYRHFVVELDTDDPTVPIEVELTMTGPQLGFMFRF